MSIQSANQALGDARDKAFNEMITLINDSSMDPGAKSVSLLKAQAEMGITDGAQNIFGKAYNRWQQTGQ